MPPRDSAYAAALQDTLRWDAARGEAYLQLPSFPSVRLTPFRPGMAPALVALFNEPQIGRRLFRLPYPMGLEYAEEWVADEVERTRGVLAAVQEGCEGACPPPKPQGQEESSGKTSTMGATPGSPTKAHDCRTDHHAREDATLRRTPDAKPLSAMPFRSVRLDGEVVGDVGLSPPEEEENGASAAWTLGYVISARAEGAGIMSESVGVVLAFSARWMRLRRIEAIAEDDNARSASVLLRNGFRRVGDVVTDWPEEKGGGKRYGGRYLWTAPGDEEP